MFDPKMMEAAQNMMQNMSADDMKRMSDMAANMDPKVMESMMKNMGGGNMPPMGDPKQVAEQLKNMSPEQMKAQMSQAKQQMGAQKQYYFNAGVMLKNEGNQHIKNGKYAEALEVYQRAIDNLRPHTAESDVAELCLQLQQNSALCYLKRNEYQKAIDSCEEALKVNPKSVKALFRRGLGKLELGRSAEALTDVKQAVTLSPEDKTITAELTRVQKVCKERGLSEADVAAAEKAGVSRASETAATPSTSSGGSSGSSTSNRSAAAVDAFAKNPEMMEQAMQAMRSMPTEDLQKMMKNSPMGGSMDAEMVKKACEDPNMMKTAMESLKSMPEEERRKVLSRGGAGGMGGTPDLSKAFENPEMLKQAAEMARSCGGDPAEADMMRKAAEAISANPGMAEQMSNMMKNMPPEQLQKMMEMSSKMKSARQGGGGADSMNPDDMASVMNDPDMMKAAEDMMKNMSPETLASMARASGMDIDEDKAKMLGKLMPFIPYVMKAMRAFGYVKKGFKSVFSSKGRMVLAVVVLIVAFLQHRGYF